MFSSEAKMTTPVFRWMQSLGLEVKSEFITPWGMCDLVGLTFRKGARAARLKLGQTQAVGSLIGAALLDKIPDAKTNRSTSLRRLTNKCMPTISEEIVAHQIQRLIEDGFVRSPDGNRLQKINGWVPLHKRLIAIELKLNRVEEALSQARNNLIFADKSYVGLPRDLAERIAASKTRCAKFVDDGVGLVAVSSQECKILIPSRHRSSAPDPVIQFYCVEKFWRTHSKDS
jgi:hypothetical protein